MIIQIIRSNGEQGPWGQLWGQEWRKIPLKFQCPGRGTERIVKAPSEWNGPQAGLSEGNCGWGVTWGDARETEDLCVKRQHEPS